MEETEGYMTGSFACFSECLIQELRKECEFIELRDNEPTQLSAMVVSVLAICLE